MAVLLSLSVASNMCRSLHVLSKQQVAEYVTFDDGFRYPSQLGLISVDIAKFREEILDF